MQNRDLDQWDRESCTDLVVIRQLECQSDHHPHHHYIHHNTPNETTRQDKELSAGSVLVDKIHEPLDALLKAYEARLKPLETMEDRWRNYLDAAIESRQLELYKRLVETLQAIEGHTKQLVGEREKPNQAEIIKRPTLYEETVEMESNRAEHSFQTRTQKEKQNEPQMIPNSNVPEVDEEWGNKL